MFVAVNPKGNNGVIRDRILIFDTVDLSCEYVLMKDVMANLEYVGTVMHICGSDILTGFEGNRYIPVTGALDNVLSWWGENSYQVDNISFKNGYYSFCNYTFNMSNIFKTDALTDIVVNGKHITSIFDYTPSLHYAFKYKDYLILRITDTTVDPVVTVVLDINSEIVCIYSDSEFMYGDKALMTKIELLFDY